MSASVSEWEREKRRERNSDYVARENAISEEKEKEILSCFSHFAFSENKKYKS